MEVVTGNIFLMGEDKKQDKIFSIANGVSKGSIGHDFTFCIEEDKFYLYGDGFWKPIYWMELIDIISSHESYRNQLSKLSINVRKQLIDNLKTMVYKRLIHFNSSGRLNFQEGEFDPILNKMFDHSKEHYSTMRIPYPFDYKAQCPLWLKTLLEIFEGSQGKIDALQEFFGYCLTTKNNQKKALLLLGESDSGKSTILFILRAMVGDFNCSSVQLVNLKNTVFTPQLMNKLVNIDADVAKDAENYEAQFKLITSNEPIQCNQKYVPTFDFLPTCKMVMAANIFPRITDTSSAFYNRLIIIPCDRIFSPEEQNRELVPALKEELSGIFNWACEGLKKLSDRGRFDSYDFAKEAVKELEDENNPTNVFFDDHIEVEIGDHIYIEKGELYEKYKKWCDINNNKFHLNKARFSSAVFKKFHDATPKNTMLHTIGKRIWRNLKYVEQKGEAQGEQVSWND